MKKTKTQLKIYYGNTFNSESGQKVLFDLVDHSGLLTPLVVDGNVNAEILAFREGAKSIVCRILEYSGYSNQNIEQIVKGVNNG